MRVNGGLSHLFQLSPGSRILLTLMDKRVVFRIRETGRSKAPTPRRPPLPPALKKVFRLGCYHHQGQMREMDR
jgi:hypothetical protein